MMPSWPASVPGVAAVEILQGRRAAGGAADLLVEVPHGADRLSHYEALRARLTGRLPEALEEFFCVNTDVGAYPLGRRVAELLVSLDERRTAVVVRSLIPRTLIDCNRIEEAVEGQLGQGGLTASVPAYVHEASDRALLLDLHRRYVAVVEAALGVLSPGGFLLMPHTYGPRTLGIDRVDDDIVGKLRSAHAPEQYPTWPLRSEVDFITRTADGIFLGCEGALADVKQAYTELGIVWSENATYHVHPSTLGHRWASRCAGRVLCLEVRRDLLAPGWTWNRENDVDPAAVERFARPLAKAVLGQHG